MNLKLGRTDKSARVVVTGMGVLTCNAWDCSSFSRSLREGTCGISEISLFDTREHRTRLAGEVKHKDVLNTIAEQEDRSLAFSKYATDQALENACYERKDLKRKRVAVCFGTIAAGWPIFERTYAKSRSGKSISRADLEFSAINVSNHLCAEYGMKGPKYTMLTACSSASHAIGFGYDLLKYGEADVALVGGVDIITELAHAGFNILRALTLDKCRPFDRNRSGFAIGEGAAVLILERLQDATRRRVLPHAEILGYGSSCDAYHATGPDPSGRGAAHAIATALRNAGKTPEEIQYIKAHGTATSQNDAMETKAIKTVFGRYASRIPISSIKPLIGHTMGAAGAIEAVASILMLKQGFLAPTLNYETPDPECDLDYLADGIPREANSDTILSNSFGFGGANCCLVVGRTD